MANRDGPMLVDGQPFKIKYRVFNFHGGKRSDHRQASTRTWDSSGGTDGDWTASRSSRSDVWMV
jgi:hypothetical protein